MVKNYRKTVLISNGFVHSSQSQNFNFENIINHLSNEYNDILFFITENINTNNPNVVFTGDLTNILPDLLHISYISTKSDVIIGRASGPFCFSQIKENLLDINKTFICFSYRYHDGKYYDNQKSKFLWSGDFSFDNIINTIKTNL